MPVKAGYLALMGAGAIVVYSGLKGKGVGSAFRSVIAGHTPAKAAAANLIGSPSGLSGTILSRFGANGPSGPVGNVSPLQVYQALRQAGVPRSSGIMLTAIAGVESEYNTTAWNQNVSTGDDSVGLFQINYLGPLYSERVALTGMTPEQLHRAGVQGQANAAAKLYRQSGLQPWEPDITSGKVVKFLGGANAAASQAGY